METRYEYVQTTAKMYAGSKYGRPPAEKGPRIERLQISEEEQSENDIQGNIQKPRRIG